MRFTPKRRQPFLIFSLLVLFLLITQTSANAQDAAPSQASGDTASPASMFRLERVPIKGGAELLTIHARLDGLDASEEQKWVPLVTILRDTLGDLNSENDRLRYLWPLTYTRPTVAQQLSAAVPFLYTRVGNKNDVSATPPPSVVDLASPDHDVWEKIFWTALQNVLLDPYGLPVKASSRSYRRNISDYRKSQIIRALSVLSLYQALKGTPAFSDSEMSEIQARLLLTDKTFGGLVDNINLQRYYEKQLTQVRDDRGHNWELLRQRAEAESLYFDPLQMPDGTVTHALLWVAKPDLTTKRSQRYDSRFLNLADPWSDRRLLNWQGYVETRYFNAENQQVPPETPGSRPIEMIPLALYGLDYPKIPVVLVDFRDALNPKKREMSRRALQDVTRNVLSLSQFGDLPYFLGRTVFDFITGRRGIDVNQPSRLRTYSQLKLLLALNQSLNPGLRSQIRDRLEKVSLNPLENDLQAESELARAQYKALLLYAEQPDGLPAKLDRDRRSEMVHLEHGKTAQFFFRLTNILSFGSYAHREKGSPEMEARLDTTRRLTYHTRFLREVSRSNARIEVAWNLDEVKRSLQFISEHGPAANSQAIGAAAEIFLRTEDPETRRLCLESLSRINSSKARNELIRISQKQEIDQTWKDLIASYLTQPHKELVPLAASEANTNMQRVEQR